MAENDQPNDEYQFSDVDVFSPESVSGGAATTDKSTAYVNPSLLKQPNVKRNILVAVVLIVFTMLTYSLIASFFKTKQAEPQPIAPIVVQVAPKQQPVVAPMPIEQPVKEPDSDQVTLLNQKITAVESSQQTTTADLAAMHTQIEAVGTQVNDLATKMSELNSLLTEINTKIEAHERMIEQQHLQALRVKKRAMAQKTPKPHYLDYNIQAIIPGRAWLVAANGSTLTVRQGSKVGGYGVITVIDPRQGRVSTSSGRIIRFSQEDS